MRQHTLDDAVGSAAMLDTDALSARPRPAGLYDPVEKLIPLHGPQVTLRPCLTIGSERRRFPVAAKTALATAGAIGGVPGSPIPPGCSAPPMIDTEIFGICGRCSIG